MGVVRANLFGFQAAGVVMLAQQMAEFGPSERIGKVGQERVAVEGPRSGASEAPLLVATAVGIEFRGVKAEAVVVDLPLQMLALRSQSE